MENVIYAAAVLGSLCVDNAAGPGIVANVLQSLHSIDQRILVLAPPDCPRCDGDWLPEEEALFKQAGEAERNRAAEDRRQTDRTD